MVIIALLYGFVIRSGLGMAYFLCYSNTDAWHYSCVIVGCSSEIDVVCLQFRGHVLHVLFFYFLFLTLVINFTSKKKKSLVI